MKSAALLAALMLPVAACSHAPSERLIDVSPAVQEYTAAEQDQAAREMEQCTSCDMLKRFITDYLTMRDDTRAAKGDT